MDKIISQKMNDLEIFSPNHSNYISNVNCEQPNWDSNPDAEALLLRQLRRPIPPSGH